ncbi:hypothetical protein INT45_012841 [Circinella minor]|uniref:N-acetyltransferase domain-containing protein n=1 Tax=Circinella minor TaxID=1195481 RepID=A0A8H7S454_9FUNG|nr:hypothetical protein INT45_012841 [Circinella minor]
MTFIIRNSINAEEASNVLYPWVKKENWDPGYDGNDIKLAYFPSDPKSFFFGTLPQQENQIVSSICAIQHNDKTGYIAFYVVESSHRKKGYGLQLFNHALDHLKESPWIGLDAVEAQMETYKKSGFVVQSQSTRYVGGIDNIKSINKTTTMSGAIIVDLNSVSIDDLIHQDHCYTGMRRPTFITNWVQYHVKHAYGFALVNPNTKQIEGFGCMRRCASGAYRIAPLYSDTPDHAFDLVTKLTGMVKDKEDVQFSVDAWLATEAPKELFSKRMGWKATSNMYRMWRKGNNNTLTDDKPPIGLAKGFYAIASPEVG